MRDLSLLTEYIEGKLSVEDFCDILLSDEALCERVRILYAEATHRDVDIISQIQKIERFDHVSDEFVCGIVSTVLDHCDVGYKKKVITPSKAERKALIERYKNNERNAFIKSLPIPKKMFKRLFDHLDRELGARGCNGRLDITTEFLEKNGLDVEKTVDWLCDNGGGCDCEVLANIEEKFETR